jgi:hypothetical protein
MKEVWKDIVGYNGYYKVSNLGRIKSLDRLVNSKHGLATKKGKVLTPTLKDYYRIGLSKNCKVKSFLVHRLVAIHFLNKPIDKDCVNHKNGIKTDNRDLNLEWCTQQENITHSITSKLVDQLGEKHHNSKLNSKQVLKIRELYKTTDTSYSQLGEKFNVNWGTIRNVVKRKTWNHI